MALDFHIHRRATQHVEWGNVYVRMDFSGEVGSEVLPRMGQDEARERESDGGCVWTAQWFSSDSPSADSNTRPCSFQQRQVCGLITVIIILIINYHFQLDTNQFPPHLKLSVKSWSMVDPVFEVGSLVGMKKIAIKSLWMCNIHKYLRAIFFLQSHKVSSTVVLSYLC